MTDTTNIPEVVPMDDAALKVDPIEAERAILTDKQKEAMNHSPEDVAAALFSMYFPVLKNVLNNKAKMTRKSLVKVMLAAVEVPLNSTEYKLLKKDEREVFSIIASLLEAKWQMMLSTLVSTHQKLAEEKAAADLAAAPTETTEVVSNENESDLKIQS